MFSHAVAFLTGALAVVVGIAIVATLAVRWWRGVTHRAAMRVHKRFGARVDRFKFADRREIIASLLDED